MTPTASTTLITADDLLRLISDEPATTRIVDVRWSVDQPDGSAAYAAGHIPGAVYGDLEVELSDHSVAGRGRHPLPTGHALQHALRGWGVDDHSLVVVYDDWNRAGSSRARWVLRAAGFNNVRILDGGWSAWHRAQLPMKTGVVIADPGSVTITHDDLDAGALRTLTPQQVAELADKGALIDARAPERYSGAVEPLDPVGGHVPGARNLPFGKVLDTDGSFASPETVRSLITSAIAEETPDSNIGVYCGSGVTATVLLTALDFAGYDNAALYPGSWSEWSGSGRAVATSPDPQGAQTPSSTTPSEGAAGQPVPAPKDIHYR